MNGSEIVQLNQMLDAVGADTIGRIPLTMAGNPQAKMRHRYRVVGTGRKRFVQTYADPEDAAMEQLTAAKLRTAFAVPLTGNLAMVAILYRATRQPIDADNLFKHIADAGNGVAWVDDSQITGIAAVIELSADYPRTVLMVGHHRTTMLRGSDAVRPCRSCGTDFPLEGSPIARQYCGTACSARGRRKDFIPFGTVT